MPATRFLVLSDTHNFEFTNNDHTSRPLQLPTPKVDVLLHCGDLTHVGREPSYRKALKMLNSIEAELKLVIAGNHDIDLDRQYWETHLGEDDELEDHGRAVRVMTGPLAMAAGVTYLNEGTHAFTLKSGARFTIYASPYTPYFCDWAFAYGHHEDRFSESHNTARGVESIASRPIPSFPNVDIVMTHGPPKGILDECGQGHVGCPQLLRALRRVKPRMHCFGHIHEGSGIEIVDWDRHYGSDDGAAGAAAASRRKNEAEHGFFKDDQIANPYPGNFEWKEKHGEKMLAVNASIMDGSFRPTNAPWIVDFDLPCVS